MFDKIKAFIKKVREKVSAGILALILSIAAIVGVALPSKESDIITGTEQSVTNRMANVQVTTGDVQFLTDGAWVGRSTANNIEFDLAGGLIDLDAENGVELDTPYAQFQTDGAWIGRAAITSSLAFDASGNGVITQTVVGGGCRVIGNATSPSLVCGYADNVASGAGAVVAGGGKSGSPNTASSAYSTVVGGYSNTASGSRSGVFAGSGNTSGCSRCVVFGGSGNNTGTVGENLFIAGSGNEFRIGVYGSNSTIFGSSNIISSDLSTADFIFGTSNNIQGATTGLNFVATDQNTIDDSFENGIIAADLNTISDGSDEIFIAGGGGMTVVDGHDSPVMGSGHDFTSSIYSGILCGADSAIDTADFATIAGGFENGVGSGADYAFAAGRRAKANNQGCFVWGDSTNADVTCSNNNRTVFRSSGGYYIYTNAALGTGMYLAAGGSAWNAVSDRDAKEDFATVDGDELLARIAAMPTIEGWQYKGQDGDILHVGAMADDFNGLVDGLGGEGADRINQGDAIGVNLAAIQALTRKVDALERGGAVTQSQAYTLLMTQPHIVVSASVLLGCAMVSLAVMRRRGNDK